jgi:PAS domain S-box-containing protein
MTRSFAARLLPYVVAGLVLSAAVWAVTYQRVTAERERNFAQSAQRAKDLASFFEQHTLHVFSYSDSYLKTLRREYLENGGLEAVRRMMAAVPLDRSIVSHITIIDQTGTPMLVSGHPIKPGATAKDRDYFKFQKAHEDDRILVSLPHRGRNTGMLLVRLVRRITLPDGSFGGVIFAALEAEEMTGFFSALNLGPKSSATLVGTDKKIRARSSYGRLGPGQDISGSRIWRELEQSPVGLYRQTSVVDDITRYYAYRRLSEFPLIVAIGVSTEDIAQAVTQFELPTYTIAVLTTIVIAIMTILICRETLVSQKLRDGETRIRTIVDSVPDGIVTLDEVGRIESFSIGAQKIFGYSPDEVVGQCVSMLVSKRGRAEHEGYIRHYLRTGTGSAIGQGHREVQGRRKDGTEFPALLSINEMTLGHSRRFVGAISDITERKKLEEQLQQAQKMEAVGQLTGGVAHDFNNLLAVIMGNADLLQGRLGEDDRSTQAIIRAATRGAELTQRLLAFSRRQPLRPRVIALDELIAGMTDLLQRTLGETIRVETSSAEGLWQAEADPGQVENALLNLALNARDAMPDGGTLSIETSNAMLDQSYAARYMDVTPGDYILLTIKDTGSGMNPEVLERAFEPFFTTKGVSEGSGLGLSMVYGFAKQSGGEVAIQSAPGRGTTVKLYLPRAQAAAEEARQEVAAEEPTAHGETVLVVEDDADVRELAESALHSLGYRVLSANDARAGLAALRAAPRVDLLLSDVVLPGGTSGPAMAAEAERLHPGLKILFISGYPTGAAHPKTAFPQDAGLLGKPFRKRQLAQVVRATLER